MIPLLIVGAALLLEVVLIVTVRVLRAEFQWLITEADELPALDQAALQKFIAGSFDPTLGWVRRPGTTGREKGKRGEIVFHIDEMGARATRARDQSRTIAAFGDSYVFCRQVQDDETWPEALARSTGNGVMNFGVGNYGADQGLLRYEQMTLPSTIQVAILGFVPETICRIQSYWKHYLEFGNTFAFKPRFRLAGDGSLELCESPMQTADDFAALSSNLPRIQALDGFYRRKFRSLQFRVPYLFSFWRHPIRHLQVIGALLLRGVTRLFGARSSRLEALPFTIVMRANIRDAHAFYDDHDATSLLRAVLQRFHDHALARGHRPLVLVIPQLIDLQVAGDGLPPYATFFEELGRAMPVLDVTRTLQLHRQSELYVEDAFGGHLSPRGNEIVAEALASWLAHQPTLASA